MDRGRAEYEKILELNRRMAKAFTLKVKESGSVSCPCCEAIGEEQPLSRIRDMEKTLFCPRCSIEFVVSVLGKASWTYRNLPLDEWLKRVDADGRMVGENIKHVEGEEGNADSV
jgi:hypothetical protein